MVDRLLAFIHNPSRNHLILSNGCLDGLKYTDVGFEVSCFIENYVRDRRLSMRAQDFVAKLFREHICKSEDYGQYLALTNVAILFEPSLKLDVESLLDRWSQNITLFLNVENGIVTNNRYYLVPGCKEGYSVLLSAINYIQLPSE
jgi:hypothetical protein